MRTAEAIRLVAAARTDADLFGADTPAQRYRELVAALHPDRLGALDHAVRAAATDAFVQVTTRWRAPGHLTAVTGDVADPGPRRRTRPPPDRRWYRLGAPAHAGDLADLYDVGADRLLKLPRDPADNDLMAREAHALRTDRGARRPALPAVRAPAGRHLPAPGRGHRRANAGSTCWPPYPGCTTSTRSRRAYPDGLDARDAAWIWRRLLVALGLAHRAGVVHGAVLPRHVLIEPDAHGVVLVDWCFSAPPTAAPSRRWSPGHEDWYPPEVTAQAALRPRHRPRDGRPLHELADGRPGPARAARLRRRLPPPGAGRPTRRRLATARRTRRGAGPALRAAHLPTLHPQPLGRLPWAVESGPPTCTTPPTATAGPPARARSPTATAGRAPCTPRSTRAARYGRAATPPSTRSRRPSRCSST